LLRRLPDRELAFAPSGTKLFYDYFAAMNAAANFAFANRQMIMHWVRESFEKVFNKDAESLGLKLIYDITHNMAKLEEHNIDGKKMKVLVHRKGATRAFGPDWPDVPSKYKGIGQPVLIPGSMGTASYIMIGTKKAEEITFASIAHGSGRVASRAKMVKNVRGEEVAKRLEQKGILVKAWSWKGVAEEAPEAYKNVDEVIEVCEKAGIARKIVRLRPIAVIKGD
jgi:tRNA-splicing ligase RtcB